MALRRALASLVPKLAQPVPELVAPFAVQACKLPMGVMTEEQQQRPQAPMLPFSRSECSMHLGEVAAQPLSGGSTSALGDSSIVQHSMRTWEPTSLAPLCSHRFCV